ncbi:MAG TPA: glycoside hydrolase family 32 protein [Roseiflexaceae bacterium]|nr:glycoside hydrolase family 32 protein [Roseiflexaceae bacterium]
MDTQAFTEFARAERARLAGDRHRPGYHFLPPSNWLNDPNGLIHWRGRYHLFYQYNPDAPHWGLIRWGHAVSDDLVAWHDLPLALVPTPGGPDEDGCWSGCAIDADGQPMLIYTGVGAAGQRPCAAFGDDDLVVWRKHPGNPLIASPPPEAHQRDFRDHVVWREADGWYQLLGAGLVGAGGTALLYRSDDLLAWEYLHPLCTGDPATMGDMWECPDFFPLDGRHVLIFSPLPQRQTLWQVGRYAEHRFAPERGDLLDLGGLFYAPQSFHDSAGRRLMFGWIQEGRDEASQQAAGWSGVMSLPRVLSLLPDGRLGQAPAPELERLRGPAQHFEGIPLAADTPLRLEGVRGDSLEIDIEIDPGDAAALVLRLRCSPDGREHTDLIWDRTAGRLEIDRRASSLAAGTQRDIQGGVCPPEPGQPLRLRVFLDRSVVEVFAQGRALASRIYPELPDSLGIELAARGGGATLRAATVYEMSSTWTH